MRKNGKWKVESEKFKTGISAIEFSVFHFPFSIKKAIDLPKNKLEYVASLPNGKFAVQILKKLGKTIKYERK